MRIGILGGSFDPPHLGHLLVARQAQEILRLNQVWLMPYFSHSWDKTVSSPQNRFAMAKLLQEKDIVVSDEEIKFPGKSYTIDTVRRLKQKYSHNDFFWIAGSDILPEFKKWKESKQLLMETTFFIFPRNGFPLTKKLPAGFSLISSSNLITSNVSSSIIRNRLKKKLSVEGLIPHPVLSYIKKQNLYP